MALTYVSAYIWAPTVSVDGGVCVETKGASGAVGAVGAVGTSGAVAIIANLSIFGDVGKDGDTLCKLENRIFSSCAYFVAGLRARSAQVSQGSHGILATAFSFYI